MRNNKDELNKKVKVVENDKQLANTEEKTEENKELTKMNITETKTLQESGKKY